MTLAFTAVTSKNDVTLCKLDVNIKNQMGVAGSVYFIKIEYKFLKEKVLLNSKFYFENQMWLIKRYARKSIYHGCIVWIEKSVTQDHCSASLGKPRDADQ